jgi:NAD(P)-dependent dehydrogenase (short-subunit alcohol dehydrogenase family)
MLTNLNGRSAVVTGGTRGIGYAIACRLIADGASVMITGTQEQPTTLPEGATYCAVDFSSRKATLDFALELEDATPDILVNNAGINRNAPFADITLETFEEIHQINVSAPLLLCQAVLGPMRNSEWGRILNISSIWGKVSREGRAAYSASKFALDGITLALAAEVASDGILCNCLAPGFIDTDLTRQTLGPEGIAKVISQVPAGRLGTPEEIAEFAAWLVSPANSYVTGQNIAIDGGFTRV